MTSEVSAGFVVREKKILMIQNQEGLWSIPSETNAKGELSSQTALRAVENVTSVECEVKKYKKRLKTKYKEDGEEIYWQPYTITINGDPENGEWVPIEELSELELEFPLQNKLSEVLNRI